MTQRLPIPGQDDGTWGDILNGYLEVAHNADGTLILSAVTAAGAGTYSKPSAGIPSTDLDAATQTTLTKASDAPTTLAGLTDVSGASSAGNAQVLAYSTSTSKWTPATVSSTTVNNATASTPGLLQLSGDLGNGTSGTATSPQVTSTHLSAALPINQGGTGSTSQNFVDLTASQTVAGTKTFSSTIVGNISGNAATASSAGTVITNANLTGDVTSIGNATTLNASSNVASIIAANSAVISKAPTASPTFTGKITTPALQVTGGAGTANQILTSDSSGNATWVTPTSGVSTTTANTWTAAQTFNAGKLLDRGEIVFDVKAYGATGNGTTDDTSAIQATITAAQSAGGGTVYLPAGNYYVTFGITVSASNIRIMGHASGGTKISIGYSGPQFTGTPVFSFTGSVPLQSAPTVALSADGTISSNTSASYTAAQTVTVASSSGLNVGDIVMIGDNFTSTWLSSGWGSRYRGEFVQIQSLTATSVTFVTALRDLYLMSRSAAIYKPTLLSGCSIQDIAFNDPANTTPGTFSNYVGAVIFYGCRDAHANNISATNLGGSVVAMYQVYQGVIHSCSGLNSYATVDIGAAEAVMVTDCLNDGALNGFSLSNADAHHVGYTRNCVVTGCISKNNSLSGFDTHPWGSDISFVGCRAERMSAPAYQNRSYRTQFISCVAENINGPMVDIGLGQAVDTKILGCSFKDGTGIGVYAYGDSTEGYPADVTVQDCVFQNLQSQAIDMSYVIPNYRIINNSFINPWNSDVNNSAAIYIHSSAAITDAYIISNTVSGAKSLIWSLSASESNFIIADNRLVDPVGTPLMLRGLASSDVTTANYQVNGTGAINSFSNSTSLSLGTTGSTAGFAGTTSAAATGNRFMGLRGSSDTVDHYSVDFDGKTQWGVGGSTASDTTLTRSAAGVLSVGSALGVSGLTGATAASRYVGATSSGAPASGAFLVGDYSIDQTGKFWICTTAGSPGTWAQASGSAATNATTSTPGIVQLAGDLSGTATAPTVAKISGITLPSSSPSAGNVLTAASATTTTWTTPAAGVSLDATSSDIQPLGTQAAGGVGQAADAGHVHAMPRLDQVNAPTTSVILNSQKITGLANGSATTDAAAFGQIPVAGSTSGTYAVGNDSRIVGALQPSSATTGDLSGTYGATTVAKVNGVAVTGTPVAGSVAVATSASTASWQSLYTGTPMPSDLGLIAWTCDPLLAQSSGGQSNGILFVARLSVLAGTITNVIVSIATAGATLTSSENYLALYSSTGTLLAQSVDQTTAWGTTGIKIAALTTPQTVPAGHVYAAMVTNGSTAPAFYRPGSAVSAAFINVGAAGSQLRLATYSSGLTAPPSSITLANMAAVATAPWMAIS